MNRRTFLSFGALPLLARPLDSSRISVITDECGLSPEESIAFARQYGLGWVELRAVPGLKQGPREYFRQSESVQLAAAKALKDAGLRVSFLNTGLLKHWLPGTEIVWRGTPEQQAKRRESEQKRFDDRFADLKLAIRCAEIFEVPKLRVFAFTRAADPLKIYPEIVNYLEEMAAEAKPKGIQLLLENEASQNVGFTAELAAIFKLVNAPNLGINWDPVNGLASGSEYPAGYALLPKARIWNVQIKARALVIGPDFLDWKGIFTSLDRDGYAGQIGLETHVFDGTLIEKAHLSMKKIQELVGKV